MRTHSNKTRSPDFSPVGRNNNSANCTVPTCRAVSSHKKQDICLLSIKSQAKMLAKLLASLNCQYLF